MDLQNALWWFSLNILSTIILGFYSMQEMACVSFNKIRLHYYVSKGMKRAIWLNYLLQNPARLFGTTLLSVNIAMFVGSECARQTYLALGFSPEIAPLTQVAFVVIFAELAPMFAARRYAEHVALLGAPLLYASARLMAPLLWSIDWISKLIDWLMGKDGVSEHVILNQEDLQKILALQDDEIGSDGANLSNIASNIFSLQNKDARHIMQPINSFPSLPSNATVGQLKQILRRPSINTVLVYHRDVSHVVAIASPRDLIRIPDARKLREHASSPWFITQHMKITHILKEFRRNNRTAAVVLNTEGLAVGVITLHHLTSEIFGKLSHLTEQHDIADVSAPTFIIDRTFSADMKVAEFNDQFDVILDEEGDLTLADLMTKSLGHNPEKGEAVYIGPFELTVSETSLTEVKKINVKGGGH
ncbi:MAG: HlyC/CorC family transporter [Parachlamydiaceae bacterium]|nr:HlyC/CorC family transporter [Parachlamydiaceae bacterium]